MRYEEDRLGRLERIVEQLSDRVAELEGKPAAAPVPPSQPPPPPPRPTPAAEPARPAAPPPSRPPRPSVDLEELLGGRLLGWLGGIAVLVGVVFFLAMAAQRGWIDETTRIVLAYFGSTALLAAGVYLYERQGHTQAALAAVAAAIASLYASTTAATIHYDLVEPAVGLGIAGLVGAAATAIAVRWNSPVVAGIGIVGAVLAPVFTDAGTTMFALAFMAIALVAAVGVLLWRRWNWLAAAVFLTSVPQLVAWMDDSYDDDLALTLVVLGLFWVLYVIAAIGYELRVPTERLRLSSASLLLADAILVAGLGWLVLEDSGHGDAGTIWVIGTAVVHVAIGAATLRGRISREVALLALAIGIGLSAIGAALALDGPALVAAWSVESVLLAWLARRTGEQRGYLLSLGFLAAAGAHTLLFNARPDKLFEEPEATAIVAVLLVTVAALITSRLFAGAWESAQAITQAVAVAGLAYLPPIALEGVLVVAAWVALAIVLTLLRDRLGGLGDAAPIYLGLAAAHTLAVEAPPAGLREGVDDLLAAALAIALTAAGAAALLRLRDWRPQERQALELLFAVAAIYLPSIAIVDATATEGAGQTPQVLLSSFWGLLGLAALIYGLVRDDKRIRIGGLALLGLALIKVALYDLSTLEEIYRVLSFIALGLLLLAGAFAYQRMRTTAGSRE
jgi:uncharacterized membrane protein